MSEHDDVSTGHDSGPRVDDLDAGHAPIGFAASESVEHELPVAVEGVEPQVGHSLAPLTLSPDSLHPADALEAPAVIESTYEVASPETTYPKPPTRPAVVTAPLEPVTVLPFREETSVGPQLTAVASVHPPEPAKDAPAVVKSERLLSLDALCGFDMFWIIGIDGVIEAIVELAKSGAPAWLATPLHFVSTQLQHKAWDGMAFEDLIFPLFIFIVGVSIVFSLSNALATRRRAKVINRIVVRSLVLYLLGVMIYHGFDQPIRAFEGQTHAVHAVRWLGVLQRIAICYGVAALLFCTVRPRTLAVIVLVLLVGYWAAMTYISVPGVGRGSMVEGKNLANYLDQRFLGGFKWDGDHDPEGYLSTIPAIATCLLGVFAGLILRGQWKPYAKVAALILGGAAIAGAGYSWGFLPSPVQFLVIKKLWTSSFVLLAGGYSAMLLGAFYLVIDVWKLRGWAIPFVWIGSNAITLYLFVGFGFIGRVATLLVGGGHHDIPAFGHAQRLITAVVSLILVLAVARFLFQRRLFIRV